MTSDFEKIRQYLNSGEIPNDISDADLMWLQAAFLRKESIITDDPELKKSLRYKSREIRYSIFSMVDPEVLESIFNLESEPGGNEQISQIISFLHSIGYSKQEDSKELPIPSNVDHDILVKLQQHFRVKELPIEQMDFTDFENVLSESQIPDWYKEIKSYQVETETVSLFPALKDRWFLFLIVMLGVLSAYGFATDQGIELFGLSKEFTLFLSIYGTVAFGRASWQTAKAERWVKTAHSYNRPLIVDALEEMTNIADDKLSSDLTNELAEDRKSLLDVYGWEEFSVKLGLSASKNPDYQSAIDKFINEATEWGVDIPREDVITEIGNRMIKKEFGETDPPSLAVVIPSYQVSPEKIRELLLSVKDQAYPVTTAYVVYNDDPNGSEAKQREFNEIQAIIDQVNVEEGRNNCHAVLLAQPSRGKREAMAMGFVAARGRRFVEQLDKYLDDYAEVRLKEDPSLTIDELKLELKLKMNRMVANLNIDNLPDIQHQRILNIDSDTKIADPLAVLNSEIMMQRHPNAGSITGDVRVETRGINLLTEMTYQRYWTAFFKERAAQSDSKQVTCMSGPWVYMDGNKLEEILPDWYFFTHVAGRATFGDDREISTRMLEAGYESLFCPDSAVWTDCPTEYDEWLRQQLRWNKSFNIYNMVLFQFLHRMDKFVQMDVVYQQTFPFALLFIMANIAAEVGNEAMANGPIAGIERALPYATSVLIFNELFFGVYGALRNRVEKDDGTFHPDYKFLMSPVYIYYHFRYLLWTKLYAFYDLFIKGNTGWGTKGEEFDEQFAKQFSAQVGDLAGEVADEIINQYESGQTPRESAPLPNIDSDFDTSINEMDNHFTDEQL